MKQARSLLVFSYGLFTVAAQALLFREFVTSFEGSDISIGIFFGTWFLWVAAGAIFINRAKPTADKLLKHIPLLLLAYLPAFALQFLLIIHARPMAGIESYALLSVRNIVLLSVVVNAPVSIITGLLFPLLCRWVEDKKGFAVCRVYILEAAGSFCGGLAVTVLLGSGVNSVKVFLVLAFIVSLASFVAVCQKSFSQRANQNVSFGKSSGLFNTVKVPLSFLILLTVIFCIAIGVDRQLADYLRRLKWSRLLPKQALEGSFNTAQAEYLYGTYRGQWTVVCRGGVFETIGDKSTAGQIAAISLAQNPKAARFLVIGSGVELCRQLLALPQADMVTWAHGDIGYIKKVDKFIHHQFSLSDNRLHKLTSDVRELLSGKKAYYDVVIVNLPEATNSVLSRYYTQEFYSAVKAALRNGGVLAVSLAGGENMMGTELINLGASTKLTLEKVFSKIVLKPGEDSWFLASDSQQLTGEPGILRDRFAAIQGSEDIFPAQALLSLYLPDRADKAMKMYSKADLPERLLINRDARPLTNLYSMLLAAKQSGAPVTKFVKTLALAGLIVFCIPVFVYMVLRLVYLFKSAAGSNVSSFDSTFMVFSAGVVSIGAVIVLLYLYQTFFGSLYLHVGLVSSLFMVGLTAGALVIKGILKRTIGRDNHRNRLSVILFWLIAGHCLVLALLAVWPAQLWTHAVFAVAFIVCGLCTGCYFPLAAGQLLADGFETSNIGSKLETADHIGGATGGVLTGLLLVAVLGTRMSFVVFILLMLSNLPAVVLKMYKPAKLFTREAGTFVFRKSGYVLFGVAASVVLCSNFLFAASAALKPMLPRNTAQALAGQLSLESQSAVIARKAGQITYFKVIDEADEPAGYIFSSEDLAPGVYGFGGRINLAVYVATTGELIDFQIVRSNETPAYLQLLSQWKETLNNRNLFAAKPFAGIDSVTGATVSSKAVLEALEKSADIFAVQVLKRQIKTTHTTLHDSVKAKINWSDYLPNKAGLYLIVSFILTLAVIYRGGFWSRIAVLCFNFIACGIILNSQYSSEQIMNLLSFQIPQLKLSSVFLLVMALPVLTALFGNIYCGYICPFGAVQELISYLTIRKLRQPLTGQTMRRGRFVKYVVLFIVVIAFFLSRQRTTLAADPLIRIFDLRFSVYGFQLIIGAGQLIILLVGATALVGSVFYTRFWCRYLCPAGAFLSLFNNLVLLKRYMPAKKFGKCEFGLTGKDKMDCLYCDKCRYDSSVIEQVLPLRQDVAASGRTARFFIVSVLTIAVFVSAVSIGQGIKALPGGFEQQAVTVSSAGQPRDVDIEKIRKMIDRKRLSDEEAEFYKKLDVSGAQK